MNSLQIDPDPTSTTYWDLVLSPSAGGLSLTVVTGDLAIAQNAATALSTWQGEVWYDTLLGMPYMQQIFGGKLVSLAFLKVKILGIVQSVAGVASAVCRLSGPASWRTVTGQVQMTSAAGAPIGTVATTNLAGALPWYVSGSSTAGPAILTGGGNPLTGGGNPLTP